MTVHEALEQLGVRPDTLSDNEKATLDRDGYLPLHDVMDAELAAKLRKRFDELVEAEGKRAGRELGLEPGTHRLANLVNKDLLFEVCFTHPRVLAAIAHVLDYDLKLSSLNGRDALPGLGHQRLHGDWRVAVAPGDFQVCNSIWLLDDFTAENGATRIVPGSHRAGKTPQEALEDPEAPHLDERLLIAPAGTVVIFNSHTWHGGTLNRSSESRRALHSYFCRHRHQQQLEQRPLLTEETAARLSEAARFVLDA